MYRCTSVFVDDIFFYNMPYHGMNLATKDLFAVKSDTVQFLNIKGRNFDSVSKYSQTEVKEEWRNLF